MDWDNFYVKFAVVFITFAVFFLGFYFTFSPKKNCMREFYATQFYDRGKSNDVKHVKAMCRQDNSW